MNVEDSVPTMGKWPIQHVSTYPNRNTWLKKWRRTQYYVKSTYLWWWWIAGDFYFILLYSLYSPIENRWPVFIGQNLPKAEQICYWTNLSLVRLSPFLFILDEIGLHNYRGSDVEIQESWWNELQSELSLKVENNLMSQFKSNQTEQILSFFVQDYNMVYSVQ